MVEYWSLLVICVTQSSLVLRQVIHKYIAVRLSLQQYIHVVVDFILWYCYIRDGDKNDSKAWRFPWFDGPPTLGLEKVTFDFHGSDAYAQWQNP